MKNARLFHGHPIITYSIATADASALFNAVFVSTDSPDIAAIAKDAGARVLERSEEMALDHVGTQSVMREALGQCSAAFGIHPQEACCIYATCPMLTATDLQRGWHALQQPGVAYAFAVAEKPFGPAGMFYWGRSSAFLSGLPLEAEHSRMIPIPPERCIDINTEADWNRAEVMYQKWRFP